ncbi:MAG: transporter [Methylibium sp.]|nr:transporter [Methylibium sp.]
MVFPFPILSRVVSAALRPSATLPRLCGLVFALASAGVWAQTPAVTTLKQAFDAAWLRQPEAASAELHRQAAQGRKAAAQGWTVEPPTLEVSSKTDRLSRNDGSRELEVGVAVPLWLPGERGRSLALAEAEAGAVDSRTSATQWRLAGALRDAWWSLHRARVEAGLARARQDSAAHLARDVARRVAAGELAKADQHQADGALAAAQAELAASQAAQILAEQALRALTAEAPAPVLLDVPEAAATAVAPLDDTEAPPAHPALRELSDRALMAERARDLADVQQRANPELTLATTRDRGAFGERYGQTITLGLRFPLGSGGVNQAKRATAGAELVEAQTLLSLERQRLSGELIGARARLLAAQAAAEAASRRAGLARETRGFVEKSFRAGETDLPSRLRVELEAFEAERQATLARLNVNQAISALNQALGLLPQ